MIVADRQIRLLVFNALVERAAAADAAVETAGLRRDQIAALRGLAAAELAALARLAEPKLRIALDPPGFDHGLRQLTHVQDRAALIDDFVRRGATASMLGSLFRLSPAQIAARRAALGVSGQGRPPMPPPRRRESVCADWHAIRGQDSDAPAAARAYRVLHDRHPDLSLATLCAIVHEFEE
jgi:hypothetical protein